MSASGMPAMAPLLHTVTAFNFLMLKAITAVRQQMTSEGLFYNVEFQSRHGLPGEGLTHTYVDISFIDDYEQSVFGAAGEIVRKAARTIETIYWQFYKYNLILNFKLVLPSLKFKIRLYL